MPTKSKADKPTDDAAAAQETYAEPADVQANAWAALAAPFPTDQIEWLPKQLRKGDEDRGRCEVARRGVCADDHPCGGWHAKSIHLTYVGHAGVTMRLNEVDPTWTWEPMALTQAGTPLFSDGGMWIRLTVLGVTRIGFGDAPGKSGGNAVKEAIGDAIRNAAMRFGVGTYLWSKSEAAQIIKAGGDPDADEPVQANAERPRQQRTSGPSGQQRPPWLMAFWEAFGRLPDAQKATVRERWPSDVIPANPDSLNEQQVGVALELIEYVRAEAGLPVDELLGKPVERNEQGIASQVAPDPQ